jgi:circadian clock protein KaiC
MKRVKTNIWGLDNLMLGGVPEKSAILLSGMAGTGKTVFGLQFLCNSKEPGVFLSFEENLDELEEQAKFFGWDLKNLVKKNKLRFLRYDPYSIEDIFGILENNIKEIGAKRVVIDSISAMGMYIHSESDVRKTLVDIENILKRNDCTSLLISEILPSQNSISRFGVEEFVTDVVVVLKKVLMKDRYKRYLVVWKVRGSDHSQKVHPYKFTKKGIVVEDKKTLKIG